MIHAQDPVGQQAFKASQFASGVSWDLLTLSSPTCSGEDRQNAAKRLFTAWPSLCREMALLAERAPRSAAEGQRLHDQIQDLKVA